MRKLILILFILVACEDTGNNVQSSNNPFEFDPDHAYSLVFNDPNDRYDRYVKEKFKRTNLHIVLESGFEYKGEGYINGGFVLVDNPEYYILYHGNYGTGFRIPKELTEGTHYNLKWDKLDTYYSADVAVKNNQCKLIVSDKTLSVRQGQEILFGVFYE